jgi:ABC-type multidrug transport system ATPase subunit
MALSKMATARLGKDVLDLENVSLDFLGGDEGQKLFNNITLRLAPGERLGLVGVNGAGKTTLLKLLNGEIEPTSGKVKRGKTVVTAVLTQEVKELDDVADLRVIEVIEREKRSFNVGGKEFTAGQLVEQLGFTNQKQWTPVRDLSGGERRRLQLLRLLVGEPNVLMLDEPTNDLDTDTLAAVEDVLDGWPGTLVVVSHDRYLLERVTDHQMALLGDGKIRGLPGGVDQYLELRESALAGSTITGGGNPVTSASSGPAEAVSGASEAEKRDARKAKNRIERQLGKLTQQEEKIHAQMVKSTADNDFDTMAELNKKLKTLADDRETLELEWLEALEVLGE